MNKINKRKQYTRIQIFLQSKHIERLKKIKERISEKRCEVGTRLHNAVKEKIKDTEKSLKAMKKLKTKKRPSFQNENESMGDAWRDINNHIKKGKEVRRNKVKAYLDSRNIEYKVLSEVGGHIRVGYFDIWMSTCRILNRKTNETYRGINKLKKVHE